MTSSERKRRRPAVYVQNTVPFGIASVEAALVLFVEDVKSDATEKPHAAIASDQGTQHAYMQQKYRKVAQGKRTILFHIRKLDALHSRTIV